MSQADILRTSLINRLMAINDVNYLKALAQIIEPGKTEAIIKLTEDQKAMLRDGLKDIDKLNVLNQEDVDKADLEWLAKL